MTTKSAPRQLYADKYAHIEPLPDPPRVNDMEQFKSIVNAAATLGYYFRNRGDVLVSGEGYLRRTAAPDEHGVFPDCIVTTGVEDPNAIIARNGYVIDEVGKPPDFVLEVASRSTGRRDYTVKREIYANFGVAEYCASTIRAGNTITRRLRAMNWWMASIARFRYIVRKTACYGGIAVSWVWTCAG